jgi:class 3 adenylate cyclase
MKLGTRVTLFLLGSMLCVNLLVLLGLPIFFSNLIKGQMESHARTYAAFIKKEIEDLPSHNRLAFSDASEPEFERAVASQFRSAIDVGEQSGGFVVDSIRLIDVAGKVVASFPLRDSGQASPSALSDVISGGGIAIYGDSSTKGAKSDSTINILARTEPFRGTAFAIDVRMDFARSMQMHRAEYSLYEILSIGVIMLVEILQAIVLLRLLRVSALRPVAKISVAMESVAQGRLDTRIDHEAKDEFGSMAARFNEMVASLDEKERLSKYVSPSTKEMLRGSANSGNHFSEPMRKRLVAFFSDIRGFTSYSETVEPEIVIRTLNRILDIQATVINSGGGKIDKFIGDEIMAVFENPRAALICALKIQMLLSRSEGYAGLRVGIGICQGLVVEGDVGFHEQKDFTVIGDAVNTAARLQAMAAPGSILVPSEMMNAPEMSIFRYSQEGILPIRGKREKLGIAKVLGIRESSRRGAAAS